MAECCKIQASQPHFILDHYCWMIPPPQLKKLLISTNSLNGLTRVVFLGPNITSKYRQIFLIEG